MDDYSSDFMEIANTGGKVTFEISDEDGQRGVSIGYQHASPYPASVYGVYALIPQGIPVMVFQLGGIGQPFTPQAPQDCIAVFMLSDQEGFFGRACPSCGKYFRTRSAPVMKPTYCPYCGYTGATHLFLTEGHKNYVKHYVDKFMEGYEKGKSVTIDLDALAARDIPNKPPHYYLEEKQQTRITCSACRVTSDIMGQFGFCPHCGHRNSLAVFLSQMKKQEESVVNPRYGVDQRDYRDAEWRAIVKQCVSDFEGFGRDILSVLLKEIPATPARKKAISEISFHNPIKAAEDIKAYFDIDILQGIDQPQQEFIKRRFLRRHIYEHNAGVADEDYVSRSGENVRVGQLIREQSSNVQTLIDLLRKAATNFADGFHSIK
jgi:predicted RNA-binding Zn-ribbon protein involved in translation (DUF1610 family)